MSPLRDLAEHLAQTYGLRARGNWPAEIERAAAVLAGELHCALSELHEKLARSPALSARFAGLLTVGETHFFRHPHHLDLVTDWLATRWAESPARRVRVWSAGCATGEEPYSLAIAIDTRLGNDALERVRIVGTDVDAESVNRARRANYRSWSFRGAPAWLLGSYFDAQPDGWMHLRTTLLRGAVEFDSAGVYQRALEIPEASLDVLFFRNVAIYLEDALLRRLYRRFAAILAPGGLLVLGPSDPRPDDAVFVASPVSDDRTVLTPRQAATGPGVTGHGAHHPLVPTAWNESDVHVADAPKALSTPPPARNFSFFPVSIVTPSSSPPSTSTFGVGSVPSIASPPPLGVDVSSSSSAPPAAALDLADVLVEAEHSADAYALRAQVRFEGGEYDAAVADMRSAIFLRPASALNLYLYACMLEHSTHPQRARAQFEAARDALVGLPADTVLEDEETTVGQLRDAVQLSLSRRER